ncbi:DUF992 domain-containing protein [Roseibium sp.]|uniref:DUF992 domain-containing protein n=1 Tax=Roseibium sp. TaxID=1936156 RepID=UPI003A97A689
MKRAAQIALAMLATTAVAAPGLAEEKVRPTDTAGVQIGTLTCNVEGETNFIVGSTATLGCNYQPAGDGPVEYYTGSVDEYGLDIGTTEKATLVWGVVAPSADMEPGALAGSYGGVTAGASVGAGIKANALVGGFDKSIALNPFSVESQTGTNITLGVSQLTLKPIN